MTKLNALWQWVKREWKLVLAIMVIALLIRGNVYMTKVIEIQRTAMHSIFRAMIASQNAEAACHRALDDLAKKQ